MCVYPTVTSLFFTSVIRGHYNGSFLTGIFEEVTVRYNNSRLGWLIDWFSGYSTNIMSSYCIVLKNLVWWLLSMQKFEDMQSWPIPWWSWWCSGIHRWPKLQKDFSQGIRCYFNADMCFFFHLFMLTVIFTVQRSFLILILTRMWA